MSLELNEIEKIPNDQYSCTQCGLVPEIIDIDYKSGSIKIKCPEHGEKNIYISNFFTDELPFLYHSVKCNFTNIKQKNNKELFDFCLSCKEVGCPKCSHRHSKHEGFIKINEINNYCEKHFQNFVKFCEECKKNFCSHKECKCNHDPKYQIEIQLSPDDKDIKEIKDKKLLLIKNKELQELLIKLLDTLIETCQKHPNNYYNINNIGNVAKRIRVTNNQNKEIVQTKILNKMDSLEIKILKFFNDKFGTNLKLEDNKLVLKDKNIGNEEFELLSHVGFQNLKEINVSHNNITRVDSLRNFKSKNILKIDLSYNKIHDINPLRNALKEKQFPKIQDIILEFNKIIPKDIEEIKRLIKGEYYKECKLVYILDESKKIRLFGHYFFKKNYKNCKIKESQNEKNISEFYEYSNIKNGNTLDITLIINENIEDLSGMFSECKNLKYIKEIFELNEKVEDISNMFSGCSKLISLPESMSGWDTSHITNMSGLFYGCESLETFPDLSNWNTAKVKKMIGIFNGCSTVQKLPDISNWTVSNVEEMSCMFNNCFSLREMPKNMFKWDTKNVKDMGNMFNGCQNLKDLTQLNNWNTQNVTCMKNMFKGCKILNKPPDVTKWNTTKVIDRSDMFMKCPKKK